MRCQTSMPQRQEYHWTRSMAASTVSTATVVNNSHSMGSASAGGATSETCPARRHQDVIDIGFPIAHADHAGRGTAVACREDGVETVEPLLALLLADGQLLASGAFANIVRVPGPDLLCQEPQGDPLRCDSQRGMDQQAVIRRVSQWSQAFGDAQMRPVGFRRILHDQVPR